MGMGKGWKRHRTIPAATAKQAIQAFARNETQQHSRAGLEQVPSTQKLVITTSAQRTPPRKLMGKSCKLMGIARDYARSYTRVGYRIIVRTIV